MIDWPAPEKCSPKLLDQPVIFKGPVGNLSMKDVDQEKVCYIYHVIQAEGHCKNTGTIKDGSTIR